MQIFNLQKFPYIGRVEGRVEVLFGTTVEELGLDLGFVDFGDGDAAELVEVAVADFAVENEFLGCDVGAVDVSEDALVLRTVAQWERDCEGVTV